MTVIFVLLAILILCLSPFLKGGYETPWDDEDVSNLIVLDRLGVDVFGPEIHEDIDDILGGW
jgi:hypothetical protein